MVEKWLMAEKWLEGEKICLVTVSYDAYTLFLY